MGLKNCFSPGLPTVSANIQLGNRGLHFLFV